MGRSNPWGDLDQMWNVGRYDTRNHCAIFGDYRLRGMSLVRGVILPSLIDLMYGGALTTLSTLPCDRVIRRLTANS